MSDENSENADRSLESNVICNFQQNNNPEEENTVIIWYQNQGDIVRPTDNQNHMNGIKEDFIEIDIPSECPESFDLSTNSRMQFSQKMVDSQRRYGCTSNVIRDGINLRQLSEKDWEERCLANFNEILNNHRRADSPSIVNSLKIKEDYKVKLSDAKVECAMSFCNSVNISCYIDGLVAILQLFNRVDSCIEKLAAITTDCHCIPKPRSVATTLAKYISEISGIKCKNCSMDFIVKSLNTVLLNNIARAYFFTVQDILMSITTNENQGRSGASSSSSREEKYIRRPKSGWLRQWLLQYLNHGVVVAITYNELVPFGPSRYRNKVMVRLVTSYDDKEFHLTLPTENVPDDDLESYLLREEVIEVLKSDLLLCKHTSTDFETILKQSDRRYHSLNVLGQIVEMLRERTNNTFRGVIPEHLHYIKIPNAHRNGVLLIVPVTVQNVNIGCG